LFLNFEQKNEPRVLIKKSVVGAIGGLIFLKIFNLFKKHFGLQITFIFLSRYQFLQ